MNRNYLVLLFIFTLFVVLSSCSDKTITLETLLDEMVDKEHLTYFPKEEFTIKQFSSYDRSSVGPDKENWWANADFTQFIREEENEGRREFVMFDSDGPGAVVRFWMTFAGEGSTESILRVYIDGNDKPVIEGNALEVLSGGVLAPEPLSSSVSPETEYEQRGHNLYLPVPYSENCKITVQCDDVKLVDGWWRPSIYYNINYRTYKSGIAVESFSNEILERAKPSIEKVSKMLLGSQVTEGTLNKESGIIAGHEDISVEIKSSGNAVSGINVKLDAENINQALRSTVLSITFDGNETVWIPVGEFFGTGYQIHSSQTVYSNVSEDGLMKSFWIMPFKKTANVKVVNYGDQDVEVELEVITKDYKWKNSSMYFGASWNEHYQINTATNDSLTDHKWHFDLNYIDLKGKGVYAGDALTIFNTVDAWWGEGDEKIYVDGEYFPSTIGTGTEDYYGYAWCRPEKFTHPFIAQPTGAGNFHPGMTVNMRYRTLDAMPFNSQLRSDIEMWHWVKTKINFAMSAYWYALPGFESNVIQDIEAVKRPVVMRRSEIYKPIINDNGIIEGEHLEVMTVSDGEATIQGGSDYGWSRDSQLWWRSGEIGSELITKFIIPEDGKYDISAMLTKAVDYGIIKIEINGITVLRSFNGYTKEGVFSTKVKLRSQVLSKGDNILKITIIGKDKNARPGNMAGIDLLEFKKN